MTAMTKFFNEVNAIFDKALAAEMPERRCDGCGKPMYFKDVAVLRGDGRVCEGCREKLEGVQAHV